MYGDMMMTTEYSAIQASRTPETDVGVISVLHWIQQKKAHPVSPGLCTSSVFI